MKKTGVLGMYSLLDFLHPQDGFMTPLVELPDFLNQFRKYNVRIFAKMMSLSPLFNSKWFAAANLLARASFSGRLNRVHTIVENSSGNMALSLAVLAPTYDIKKVVAIVPRDIAPGKAELLRLYGVETRHAPGTSSGIALAKELGEQEGWYCPKQYENEDNVGAYEAWLGPQIWEQTQGKITVFAAGIGTGGTVTGVSRYLKEVSGRVNIIGVTPIEDNVPGVRTIARLEEIQIPWSSAIDYRVEVATRQAFLKSLKLFRSGIFGGPSSGLALAGLLEFLQSLNSSSMDMFRNKDSEVIAVFVCPDSHLPYLEKYSTHLSDADLA